VPEDVRGAIDGWSSQSVHNRLLDVEVTRVGAFFDKQRKVTKVHFEFAQALGEDESRRRETLNRALQASFGEPQHEGGCYSVWDTPDGNVVLQRGEITFYAPSDWPPPVDANCNRLRPLPPLISKEEELLRRACRTALAALNATRPGGSGYFLRIAELIQRTGPLPVWVQVEGEADPFETSPRPIRCSDERFQVINRYDFETAQGLPDFIPKLRIVHNDKLKYGFSGECVATPTNRRTSAWFVGTTKGEVVISGGQWTATLATPAEESFEDIHREVEKMRLPATQ
jgi:hypothetical protein